MATAVATTDADTDGAEGAAAKPAKGGRRKLVLLAVPVVLAGIGAALWFTGVLPRLLGMAHPAAKKAAQDKPVPPTFFDMPDIVANLDTGNQRPSFVKLKVKLELGKASDVAVVQADLPRLLDLFQTYLRDMRPEELRGSAGTWRLREELIGRANVALAPATVKNVLFTEMIVQ
jgi:flagellar FliL protein